MHCGPPNQNFGGHGPPAHAAVPPMLQDIARYWLKITAISLPHLAQLAVTPLEIRRDLWHHKTRVAGLSYGVVFMILCVAVLVQHWRVMDKRTCDSIYYASIVSCSKNLSLHLWKKSFTGSVSCPVINIKAQKGDHSMHAHTLLSQDGFQTYN